jgi:GNAT superfamily N-acetyltransferase
MTELINEVEIRLAQTEDKEAVLAFCQHTWEDRKDYIDQVWDKWLADEKGKIFVAVIDNQPVAMIRVVLMSEREAWWEGLRVDPRYRKRGLVKLLEASVERYLVAANINISRSAVLASNEIMNGIMIRRGRQKVGRYFWYVADSINSSPSQLKKLEISDFDSIWNLITTSPHFDREVCLYISRSAKWQELTAQNLTQRLVSGQAWGLKQDNHCQSMAIQSYLEGSNNSLWIGYATGDNNSFSTLLNELRSLAYCIGYPTVSGFFPQNSFVADALANAGYRKFDPEELWVYEW